MSERPPLDPAVAAERALAAIAPSPPSEDDLTVSARLRELVERRAAEHGQATPRSHEGTVLRSGEPEQITPLCVGSAKERICVPAFGNVWVCNQCGAQMPVTAVVGERVPPCDRRARLCVHPRPARRASPRACEGR